MGEEADGQHMLPEDYAALYIQFAAAIHKLVPEAKLGGPAFEGTYGDVQVWPDAMGRVSFLNRFLDYLRSHGHLNDFTFFSFEHYPFHEKTGTASWNDLLLEPQLVHHVVQAWKDNGLPPNLPFFMSEGNYGGSIAWGTSGGTADIKSGLWLADYVGAMLSEGAGGTYYFNYTPTPGRNSGSLALDNDYHVLFYPPQYLAAQVISHEWVQPVDAPHRLFRATGDLKADSGEALVTAYAVQRPDGLWSVMLINKDHDNQHAVHLKFVDEQAGQSRKFTGAVQRVTLSGAEYQWHAAPGTLGHADPDGPAGKSTIEATADGTYVLPKASIVVLRGQLGESGKN
jgi:hypothetical protein